MERISRQSLLVTYHIPVFTDTQEVARSCHSSFKNLKVLEYYTVNASLTLGHTQFKLSILPSQVESNFNEKKSFSNERKCLTQFSDNGPKQNFCPKLEAYISIRMRVRDEQSKITFLGQSLSKLFSNDGRCSLREIANVEFL